MPVNVDIDGNEAFRQALALFSSDEEKEKKSFFKIQQTTDRDLTFRGSYLSDGVSFIGELEVKVDGDKKKLGLTERPLETTRVNQINLAGLRGNKRTSGLLCYTLDYHGDDSKKDHFIVVHIYFINTYKGTTVQVGVKIDRVKRIPDFGKEALRKVFKKIWNEHDGPVASASDNYGNYKIQGAVGSVDRNKKVNSYEITMQS